MREEKILFAKGLLGELPLGLLIASLKWKWPAAWPSVQWPFLYKVKLQPPHSSNSPMDTNRISIFFLTFFSWCIYYREHFFTIHVKDIMVKKGALCIKRIVTHNDFKILGKCLSLILLSIWAFKCIVMWKGQWKDYILEQFGVVNVPTLFLHLKGKNSLDLIKKGNYLHFTVNKRRKGKASSVYVIMVNVRK